MWFMTKDKDIREPLFDFLEEEYGKTRIIEEKNIGDSRADVIMVTEKALYGIEIKSDADTYARLAGQIKDYDQYFDGNIVVIGSSHAHGIEERVPDYWGIITVEIVEGACDFYILRKPLKNPKMKYDKKLSILWRPEIAALQELNEMPKYAQLSKKNVIAKICERIPQKISEECVDAQICDLLFERDYEKIAEILNEYRIAHGGKAKKARVKRRRKRRTKKIVG